MIPRKTFNLGYRDETYVLSNGHETCQNYYGQIIIKHISWLSDFGVKNDSNTIKCISIILLLIGLYETTGDP